MPTRERLYQQTKDSSDAQLAICFKIFKGEMLPTRAQADLFFTLRRDAENNTLSDQALVVKILELTKDHNKIPIFKAAYPNIFPEAVEATNPVAA